MTLGKKTMWVGGLVLGLAVAASGQSAPAGDQNVPNAPVPQTLPDLNTITPVAQALPPGTTRPVAGNDDAASGSTSAADPQQTTAPSVQDQDQGLPPASSRSAENTLRLSVQYHSITFTVKDPKGNLVPGITSREVRVYEDGLRQRIAFFSTDPLPLSVALVIDQSVTHDTMEKINASLSALQGAFGPSDEIAVFTYNNGVKKQTDFTAAQSARLGAVLERSKGEGRDPLMGMTGPLSHGSIINNQSIDGVPDPGHSAGSMSITVPREFHTLNDAILAAATAVSTVPRDRRRVVYVVSDGKEYGSKANQKEVIRYLLTNNITVWATQVGDAAIPGMGFLDRVHIPLTMRDDVLPKYTAATGGQWDSEFRPKGIEQSFERISSEVRAQYTVGYNTTASPFNESYRRTEVRVLKPGLTIIAKEGYYPSAADSVRRQTTTPTTPPPAKP
jgi:VWFA-related protein